MVENVKETRLYQWLFKKDSKFLNQVDQAIRQVEDMLENKQCFFELYNPWNQTFCECNGVYVFID